MKRTMLSCLSRITEENLSSSAKFSCIQIQLNSILVGLNFSEIISRIKFIQNSSVTMSCSCKLECKRFYLDEMCDLISAIDRL
jgi:hypothetical protein